MAIFGKDYSDEFESLNNQISEIKKDISQYHLNNGMGHFSDDIKDNTSELIRLKQEVELMKNELGELKSMVLDLHDNFIKPQPVEVPIKKNNRGGSITNMVKFEEFARERYYDIDSARFYSIGKDGSQRFLQLNFRQLVALINGYRKGLSVPKMNKTNPILNKIPITKLQNYIYIWRAGGFNKAIETTARELGFNPKKLISHECDEL